MLTKISAFLSVIGNLYETGEKIITKGKELLFGGNKELSPQKLLNEMTQVEKIQYDTTFKQYTKDEIVEECLTRVKEELFMSLSLEEIYTMIVTAISKTVRKLMDMAPIKIGGRNNGTCKVVTERKDTEAKNEKYAICGGFEI